MDALWREIRYTLRRLVRSPTVSLAAVITMALGIGVAAGAYSIFDGLVLRGVSFEEAGRLVALRRTNLSGPRRSTSVPEHDFADWCDEQRSFEALVGFRSGTVNLRDTAPGEAAAPERYSGAWVSPGFLDLLRVRPLLGRGFAPTDAASGADLVVLIGYQVWQQHFGGAAGIVGRTVRVNGRPTTIVGVLPRDFHFPVLFFVVAISVLSAFIAGILPAVRAARPNLIEMLHDRGRGATTFGAGRLSRWLAVFALALSCALAVAGSLSVRSTLAAQSHELNFDTTNILTARIDLVEDVCPEKDDWRVLHAQIRERVAARPEVVAAAIGTVVPADTQLPPGSTRYKRPGETYEAWWQMPVARSAVVSPGYFAAFGVEFLAGRDFNAADREGGPLVVVVNEDFARKEWPGKNAVGQRVHLWLGREKETADPNGGWAQVVGLVPNLRFSEFSNEDNQQAIYLPLAQHPQRSALVIARTRTDPTAFTATLRRTVQAVDTDLPLFFVRSMDQVLEATLFYHQLIGLTFVIFGTMALLLAAVGLYGVTLVSVMQRIPEMGVRMALGARPQDVVRLILKQGLTKTAVGLGAGLALGWGLGKALESFLFQVRTEDPVTFSAIPLFLLAVSLLAHLLPARRASRVDPVEALHSE